MRLKPRCEGGVPARQSAWRGLSFFSRDSMSAIAFVVVLGLLEPFFPLPVIQGVTRFLSGVTSSFMRLLNTFAGFMMFICIINGICGIGTVGEFNKIGRKMIGRYLGLPIAVTIGILMDFFLTGARVGILLMELALQARAFGMLDVEMLRSRQD